MVWKHLKKPAILVASLALAVGIAPMAAFAAEGDDVDQGDAELTAQALVEIDSVSVTVTPPVAGETTATDPSVAVPAGSNYSVNNSFWSYSAVGEKYGTSDEHPNVTFEEGKDYYIYASLAPNTGYTFVEGPDGTSIQVIGGALANGMVEFPEYLYTISSVTAKAATPDTPTTPDEPAADEPESTEPAATEPTPAATDTETTATETSTTTQATTSSTNTTASTLPKTADALPVALFGAMALMSALVLAMAWRLRRN